MNHNVHNVYRVKLWQQRTLGAKVKREKESTALPFVEKEREKSPVKKSSQAGDSEAALW